MKGTLKENMDNTSLDNNNPKSTSKTPLILGILGLVLGIIGLSFGLVAVLF